MTGRDELLRDLGQIPHDEDGPVFKAPWEAAAFALAVRLSQEGHFTWAEWTEILTEEIAEAQRQGDPDLGNTYYHHWASALERLCAEKGLVGRPDMDRRKEEWRRAYLNTPHGKPIELAAAFRRPVLSSTTCAQSNSRCGSGQQEQENPAARRRTCRSE